MLHRKPRSLRNACNLAYACKVLRPTCLEQRQLAEQAMHSNGGLYLVERHAWDMRDEDRWRIRQGKAVPISKHYMTNVGPARPGAQRISHSRSPRSQPETLGSAYAPPGRWGCAHR